MADPWQKAYDLAIELARNAGEEIRDAGEKEIKVCTKSCAVDLVTKTDQRVEKIIVDCLKKEFPDHCFIGEESVADGKACVFTDKPTWIIDPVDGTTNFVHGFPFVAVSIAFAVNKQLEFGVVYSCLEDKMYRARKGMGAFCNSDPIQVSDVTEIKKSIIMCELGIDRSKETVNKIFSTMQKILRIPVHGLRGSGTAATNMCLVATGSVEAFFEIGIHCWDIAAGAVIIQEAGGVLLDVNGGRFDLMSRRVVCANNEIIAKRIIQEIITFPVERDDVPEVNPDDMDDPWQKAYILATKVARNAGAEIREAGEKEIKICTKSSAVDLVTKTDQRVEKIIMDFLKKEFPDHCFIGEESVAGGKACVLTDKPTWIIDPVDGTTNFVHGFPFVAVSIAFAVNKQLEFGVVYSCLEDKMYRARKGMGAFCDCDPIQVSDVTEIKKSIVISEHGTDRSKEKVNKIFSTMQKILCIPVHGLRGSGTAATNMCLVATGSVEAFFEIGIHCWDIAAGAVIIQEAGGVLLDVNGGPFDLMSRRVVCANNEIIAKRIIQEIETFPAERDDVPEVNLDDLDDPWQKAYILAAKVARNAGAEIREAGEKEIKICTKSSAVDLVTKTDQRVEKIIMEFLKKEFPDHCFIGEESVADGKACVLTNKPTWIIDPVDGTTNFVHGFPFVAVSIAFAVNKQLEFGVVYSCLEDKMYRARKGMGAFCDCDPIQVSDVTEIKKSIVISEHGTDRSKEKVNKIFSTMQKILCIPVHGLRGSGTAATNMCLVATGAVEAFFEIGIHCWDIAAGAVIIQEAGGVLLDVNGGPFDLMSRRVVCANNEIIARRIIQEIETFPAERDDSQIQQHI